VTWLDYAVVAFLVLGAIAGFRRGFASMLMGALGHLVAAAVAVWMLPRAVSWADARYSLLARLESVVARYVVIPVEVARIEIAGSPADRLMEWVDRLNLPVQYTEMVQNQMGWLLGFLRALECDTLGALLYRLLALLILEAGAFLVLFLAVRVFWALLFSPLVGAEDGRPGVTDRLAGAVCGVVRNGVVAAVILGLLSPLVSTVSPEMQQLVGSSRIALRLISAFYYLTGLLGGRSPG